MADLDQAAGTEYEPKKHHSNNCIPDGAYFKKFSRLQKKGSKTKLPKRHRVEHIRKATKAENFATNVHYFLSKFFYNKGELL